MGKTALLTELLAGTALTSGQSPNGHSSRFYALLDPRFSLGGIIGLTKLGKVLHLAVGIDGLYICWRDAPRATTPESPLEGRAVDVS